MLVVLEIVCVRETVEITRCGGEMDGWRIIFMGLDIFRSLLRRGSFVLKPSVYSLCFPVQARGIKIFMDKKRKVNTYMPRRSASSVL